MSDPVDERAVSALRALAHPVRLGIMQELTKHPETCACDFTELFAVAQPTISAHLKTLRQAGLVTTRRRGTQICYSIAPQAVEHVQATLARLTPTLLKATS